MEALFRFAADSVERKMLPILALATQKQDWKEKAVMPLA